MKLSTIIITILLLIAAGAAVYKVGFDNTFFGGMALLGIFLVVRAWGGKPPRTLDPPGPH